MVKKVSTHVAGLSKKAINSVVKALRLSRKYGSPHGLDSLIYGGDGHVYMLAPFYGVRWSTPELVERFGESRAFVEFESLEFSIPELKMSDGVVKWADLPWVASDSSIGAPSWDSFFPSENVNSARVLMPSFNPAYLSTVVELVAGGRLSAGLPVSLSPQATTCASVTGAWSVFCSYTDVMGIVVPLDLAKGSIARSALAGLDFLDIAEGAHPAPVSALEPSESEGELTLFPETEPSVSEPESVTAEFPTVQSETGDVVADPVPTSPTVSVEVSEAVIPVGVNTCPEFGSIEEGTVYRFGRLHHRVAYVKVSADRSRVIVGRKAGYVAGSDPVGESRLNSLLNSLGVAC